VQLGMIRHPAEPRIDRAILLVFAADHGLTEEGVSQYPSAVTVAMVMTYLAGRASAMPLPRPAALQSASSTPASPPNCPIIPN